MPKKALTPGQKISKMDEAIEALKQAKKEARARQLSALGEAVADLLASDAAAHAFLIPKLKAIPSASLRHQIEDFLTLEAPPAASPKKEKSSEPATPAAKATTPAT